MSQSQILVVAVDGLRASSLGAYGNTTYATPALDLFASESLLLDSCFAPSAMLAPIYRGLWQSLHPLRPPAAEAASPLLPRLLAEAGYETTLVTDDEVVFDLHGVADFQQAVGSPPSLSDVFAAASEVVASSKPAASRPQFVWLHARGLYGPWRAPLELQTQLLDEGDPPPVDVAEPPDFVIAASDNPDTAFRYGCAYAAQVMLLDDCWNGLMRAIDDGDSADRWLVMLIGVRGFPLGEHDRVGGVDLRMHVEQLHVPWLVRFPDGRGRLSRRGEMTTHLDLLPTLAEWAGLPCPGDGLSLLPLAAQRNPPWRDALLSTSDTARAIRTPEWTLREDDRSELYVRPDDRWEANDVAARCPDIVAGLQQFGTEAAERIDRGQPMPSAGEVDASIGDA